MDEPAPSVLAVGLDASVLTGAQARIIEAVDVEVATSKLSADPPDAIVLDESAIEFVARAREEELPVLVIAGSRAGLLEALRLGASDGVVATDDSEEIVARVNAALRGRSAQDSLLDANARLASLSQTDVLTGLPNRRDCEQQLAREIAINERHGRGLGVILLELDRFRSVNDTLGAEGGDDLLVEVARRLADVARSGDVHGRWGGDDFIVITPGTDRAGTLSAGERLREAVTREPLEIGGSTTPITISVGWSFWTEGDSADDLIDRARAAVREAKAAGRDTVRPAVV